MSVVVDYRGPWPVRKLAEMMEIPIFDRVTEIRYRSRDLKALPLKQEDIARLPELEQLELTKFDHVDSADVQSISDRVPPCRLKSVSSEDRRLTVKVDMAMYSCAAN